MPDLTHLWAGMLTRNSPGYAGTNSRIVLIVCQNGFDRLHHTFSDTPQDDQERGQANLYELNVATNNIDPDALDNSSIRVGIRGDDLWCPEHFVVWGECTDGTIRPLAIETDLSVRLSTAQDEGNLSLPLRLVNPADERMPIRRLLMLMTTADEPNAGTDSPIELQITSGGSLVVDFDIPDTPQAEQERAQANFYFVPVSSPFTKADLTSTSIRLRIRGGDMWIPGSFFLFGLDDAEGRPESLVPLVHIPTWRPRRRLSTDSSEGVSSVELELV